MVLINAIKIVSLSWIRWQFPSPYGDYGSYHLNNDGTDYITSDNCFRPLTGIMVLIFFKHSIPSIAATVSVPLRGLWFLSAPFINAFMKPSKWHFAGRIISFHHFSSFARKWFSKNCLELNFKAAGLNRPSRIFKKQIFPYKYERLSCISLYHIFVIWLGPKKSKSCPSQHPPGETALYDFACFYNSLMRLTISMALTAQS